MALRYIPTSFLADTEFGINLILADTDFGINHFMAETEGGIRWWEGSKVSLRHVKQRFEGKTYWRLYES